MGNYGNAKKVIGMKFITKFVTLACFLLFSFFLFSITKFFIKDFNRGYSHSGIKYVIFIIIAEIILMFFAFGLPYLILKLYPKIYYYEDGFQVGKKNAKILYEKLDYFFMPAYNRVNSFIAIKYTDNEGNWKSIPAVNYASHSFELFQQDFINVNFPKVMKKLENNEIVEFLFNNPKKKIIAFGNKKYIAKKLEQALKIKVTRESITFDDEIYEWDKYKIFVSLGSITVQEKDGTPILALSGNALIHRVNLLEAIINTFKKN